MKKYLAGLLCLALMATLVIKVPVSAASPKLSATKATMYVGDTLTLSVKGAKKVTWSTDKKKVATVTQKGVKGVVKAYAKGNARITAKAGTKKLVCKVTVKAAKLELSVKSVIIGLANPQQTVTAKLNDKAIKASKLKWTSKDAKIATVSKGVIEAKAAGKTTITAAYKKVKAAITVEVIDDAEKAITGKGFETNKTTIMVTDSDETLPAQAVQVFFDGADVTSKVTSWVSSDTDVIEFDEGEFTIGDAGQATLTATYQGQTLTFTIIVKEAPEEADTDDEEEEDEDEEEDDEDDEDLSDDSEDADDEDTGDYTDGDDGDESDESDE